MVVLSPVFHEVATEEQSEKPLACLLKPTLTRLCTHRVEGPAWSTTKTQLRELRDSKLSPALHCDDATLPTSKVGEDGESLRTLGPLLTQLRPSCPPPLNLFGEEIILC